jgi:hypothetical protein
VIPYSLTAQGQLAHWQGNFQLARTYFQAAQAAGREMTLDEAVALVLKEKDG